MCYDIGTASMILIGSMLSQFVDVNAGIQFCDFCAIQSSTAGICKVNGRSPLPPDHLNLFFMDSIKLLSLCLYVCSFITLSLHRRATACRSSGCFI